MSGIYIPNMKMPTSCGYCPFKYRTMEGDECMFNARSTEYQKRPSDCPLVAVPAHGRLIDANALKMDLTRFYDGEVVAKRLIDEQPTIIPASEEGE